MTEQSQHQQPDQPLVNFSNCHSGILTHLDVFGELPALLAPAAKARKIAEDALAFFRKAVFEHHAEEENELFPAVLSSAVKGAERDQITVMVDQLTAEHRTLEAAWNKLEPELKKIAKGQSNDLNSRALEHLVTRYRAHAQFEESSFLPLAHLILSRNKNHMDALSLSLHMRHVPRINAHI
jgi:hemerythrin-like domain-containing protein